MNKWSIIMPVYLGEYLGRCSKAVEKFDRAIRSFDDQDYENKELVIISDGCDVAAQVWANHWATKENIIFLKIPKQSNFAGITRELGIKIATGIKICYLDADDILLSRHLSDLEDHFIDDLDWVWFDDCIATKVNGEDYKVRSGVCLKKHRIGTSNIAHKRNLNIKWGDGYGHDWSFIQTLMKYPTKRVEGKTYIVCHLQQDGKSILDL